MDKFHAKEDTFPVRVFEHFKIKWSKKHARPKWIELLQQIWSLCFQLLQRSAQSPLYSCRAALCCCLRDAAGNRVTGMLHHKSRQKLPDNAKITRKALKTLLPHKGRHYSRWGCQKKSTRCLHESLLSTCNTGRCARSYYDPSWHCYRQAPHWWTRGMGSPTTRH